MTRTAKNQGVIRDIDNQQSLLDVAESYLQESVAPVASDIDSHPEALRDALKGLGDRSLLALKVPQLWGGAEVNEATFRRFQQLVPRYSGALAFLQTQHQSAGGLLAKSENEFLKQQYLPRMGKGEVLVGVGFSQLRRNGEPLVKAIPVEGGYQVTGTVPWVTGFGFFQDFIVGAVLPDGRELYGIVPFTETNREIGGAIAFSEPMELAAMTSTNTVTAALTHWFLPQEQVLFVKKPGAIHESDKKNVLNHGFFALGCAGAGLDILETTAKRKQLEFIQYAFESLHEEFTCCQAAMMQALPPNSCPWEERLQLRVWAINLAGRCANAAVTASSGAANTKYHGAQRVYREALVFTVSGQTTAVMEATLTRLVNFTSCGEAG
ncbi:MULTISPECIES: acyl-CoA dehydrogenase family protein [unclassified Coleofasciculus]|uniref:acyl-CoA dehydrogenase family protein n=1 Tax=unclassified Coleofasciculus TaxID=2692782 RepID=UPI00187E4872|nr:MULTISPECIES: acyl-CoA dehydrogenase family protein [unclassified Coleofasciculus]MBE9126749.1 acyl-CoA/acyl-ACP dehydrogenase [Coleofasciculus sp. LEGE 07081]MBE9150120.1 acyl-CoA/acyl-ACP dehydrogenase [Coleofasciculus sp. LEGE 07092]